MLEKKQFSMAAETLYALTWSELADWYLEMAKVMNRTEPESKKQRDELMLYVLQTILKLWHPFTPFVTEVIWKQFATNKFLMLESWPTKATSYLSYNQDLLDQMERLQEIIISLRNARAENKVAPSTLSQIRYFGPTDITPWKALIESMARVTFVPELTSASELKGSWFRLATDIKAQKPVVDETSVKQYITDLEAKLADSNFTSRAPVQVIEETKRKLAEARAKLV
jgi:valyl-tRNA synthetase